MWENCDHRQGSCIALLWVSVLAMSSWQRILIFNNACFGIACFYTNVLFAQKILPSSKFKFITGSIKHVRNYFT